MNSTIHCSKNSLLNTLPKSDLSSIMACSKLVRLEFGEVLYESATDVQYMHFPVDSVVSLMYETIDGKSSEIVSIGNNGAVGSDILLSDSLSCFRALTISEGWAYQINKSHIRGELSNRKLLNSQLLNYIQNLTTEISFNGVCSRFHKIEQQYCKFLLLYNDRAPGKIPFTQEAVAHFLGVRRETITDIANKLQKENILYYIRGQIKIIDREALESHSCECYQAIKNIFDPQDKIAA